MGIYRIADTELDLDENADKKVITYLKDFQSSEDLKVDVFNRCVVGFEKISFAEELIEVKKKYSALSHGVGSICYGIKHFDLNGEWKHQIFCEPSLTEGFLIADEKWKHLVIFDYKRRAADYPISKRNVIPFRKIKEIDRDREWIELFLVGFYSFSTLHNTMMIHASAIKYLDKAVLFTAPSGTGKTTQAELWRDYTGAKILNGDRVFIKSTGDEERLYAWGSPWAGSSPYVVNDSAEVAAVVVLEQAKENSLRRMDAGEAMMHLSSNSFLPMWDARCLEGMLGVMDLVLRKVPVYKLACRPDEEAVELVRGEVFG